MHDEDVKDRQHDHTFGQDQKRPGEARTLIVVLITATMMIVEIIAGLVYGSMALLADGLHMAAHAAALGISLFAYSYTRRHAHDKNFNFGTGKVNSLAGFTGAILLAVFALMMVWESVHRMIDPVTIAFDQAIIVAVIGLVVNGVSVLILGHKHGNHGHKHRAADSLAQPAPHHDHNLRSAYLHVLADTLTSVLAIGALLAGKYYGWNWLDPAIGIVGALLVARWSFGLLRSTSAVLLDKQGPAHIHEAIASCIEGDDENRLADLHLWVIGPDIYAAELNVVTANPRPPDHYRSLLPDDLGIVHVTVEVNQTSDADVSADAKDAQ